MQLADYVNILKKKNYFLIKDSMETYSIPNTPMKILLNPVYFEWGKVLHKIPEWYAFDWLSIPSIFQGIVDMNQTNNIKAWLIHDWMYSDLCQLDITRKLSDKDICDRIWLPSNILIYIWLRLFWWLSWRKDSNYRKYKEEIIQARLEHNLPKHLQHIKQL